MNGDVIRKTEAIVGKGAEKKGTLLRQIKGGNFRGGDGKV